MMPALSRRRIAVVGLIAAAALVFAVEAFRTGSIAPSSSPPASSLTFGQIPAGWQTCSRPDLGFAIAYPGGWYTPGGGNPATSPSHSSFECLLFEPKPFEVPPENATVALVVSVSRASFSRTLSEDTDPRYVRVLAEQDTRIAGERTVRMETEATGQGSEDRGTKGYDYIVDLGPGGALTVGTTSLAGAYEADKGVVDQAAASLTLIPGKTTEGDVADPVELGWGSRARPRGPAGDPDFQ